MKPASSPTDLALRPPSRARLDATLVARGLAPSREKAARLILAGVVTVDGRRIDKAGTLVPARASVAVAGGPRFVSRGGDKLAHALSAFAVDPSGRTWMDVGASTGGFTHCLLQHGAARVYAIDVGAGQLAPEIRADGRVVVMDRTNGRYLRPEAFAVSPERATIDVSFISLEKVLPAVFGVLAPGAEPLGEVVALVKPQFEVGRGAVGKGGVVRNGEQHREVLTRLARFVVLHRWHVRDVTISPLRGPKGNREFFLHLTAGGRTAADLEERVAHATEETGA
jgi:23S rRNA (cytidine1920-2'-O)/16S rRNA (cytidine1409-2'-O)-methyltransferase